MYRAHGGGCVGPTGCLYRRAWLGLSASAPLFPLQNQRIRLGALAPGRRPQVQLVRLCRPACSRCFAEGVPTDTE
jgi:hypothetical protein